MAPKNGDGDGASAWTPPGLGRRQWGAALRRAVAEFREDRLTDQAAALTYYGVLALSAAAIAVTGPVTTQVGKAIGLGNTGQTIFDIAKWPVILLVVSFMFSLLYYAAPNVRQRGFRWITPGGVVAVTIWLVASAGFA